MKSAYDFLRLKAELTADGAMFAALLEKNRKASERATISVDDEFAWVAVGYTIHNLYCLFEDYFLRIAKFFENGLDPSSRHADLVKRMALDIPDVRPSLFDSAFALRVDELRRFRHAFRNLYQTELDPGRVKQLNESVPRLIGDFSVHHARFCAVLDSLALGMGRE